MKKIKGKIESLNFEFDDIELPIDFELLIELKEARILPIKYKDKNYLGLFNDLQKEVIVFDSKEID